MVRKSREDKARSREMIVDAAARLIRQKGIDSTSVGEVMAAAGMTHGGFYRHFASKDELVAEAITRAFLAGLSNFSNEGPGTKREAEAYIEQYLSQDHVESPEKGCPIPLLSAEIARGGSEWKEALSAGFGQAATKLSEGMGRKDRDDALMLLTNLVGTLAIARGVGRGALRDELLAAANRHISRLGGASDERPK